MTIQISTFNFNSIPVRIHTINNEVFFCLLDVASILGLGNRSISKFNFNPKGVEKLSTPTNGGIQEVVFINEPNLYRVIFRSNKAEAIDFQNWVFEEVLPQIRKTGSYERKTTVDERTGLRDAVNMLVSKRGLMYSEAYQLVHQRFNVPSIEDLTPEQLPQAVEYVHKICLEGELIIEPQAEPGTSTAIPLTFEQFMPFIVFHSKWKKAVVDLVPIYEHLRRKGDTALADIVNNHFEALNPNTALFDQIDMVIWSSIAKIQRPEEQRLLRYFI